jgi:uncharacterized protein YkwD
MNLTATLRGARLRFAIIPLLLFAGFLLFSACSPEVNAEMKTYSGINAIRVQSGLPPLTVDANLVKVARVRSADMAAKSYFSHTPPDGCNFVCVMDGFGIPHAYSGENIAWNTYDWTQTADMAVTMWNNSPPHMENILNCRYQRFGTGVAKAADGKVYYTMIFEGNASC